MPVFLTETIAQLQTAALSEEPRTGQLRGMRTGSQVFANHLQTKRGVCCTTSVAEFVSSDFDINKIAKILTARAAARPERRVAHPGRLKAA